MDVLAFPLALLAAAFPPPCAPTSGSPQTIVSDLVVEGVVSDPDGAPLGGASIELDPPYGSGVFTTSTNADGGFALVVPRPIVETWFAELSRNVRDPVRSLCTDLIVHAAPHAPFKTLFAVARDATRLAVDPIRLRRASCLELELELDASLASASWVEVRCGGFSFTIHELDASGRARLDGLSPGVARVQVSARGQRIAASHVDLHEGERARLALRPIPPSRVPRVLLMIPPSDEYVGWPRLSAASFAFEEGPGVIEEVGTNAFTVIPPRPGARLLLRDPRFVPQAFELRIRGDLSTYRTEVRQRVLSLTATDGSTGRPVGGLQTFFTSGGSSAEVQALPLQGAEHLVFAWAGAGRLEIRAEGYAPYAVDVGAGEDVKLAVTLTAISKPGE